MIPTASQLRLAKKILLGGIAVVAVLLCTTGVYVLTHTRGSATEFPYECGLVFGAGVWGIGNPSPAIERRVGAAAALYNDGKVERLILSGGKGDAHRDSEALVMRKVAMRMGVDAGDILLEDESKSTVENLELSKELLGECESVVGISDKYHLARIEMLARRAGVGDLPTAGPSERPPLNHEIRSTVREVLGIIYYQLLDLWLAVTT